MSKAHICSRCGDVFIKHSNIKHEEKIAEHTRPIVVKSHQIGTNFIEYKEELCPSCAELYDAFMKGAEVVAGGSEDE